MSRFYFEFFSFPLSVLLHQLSNWQHHYINTTAQMTMFNNSKTSKEDQVSTGRLQLYVQIQFSEIYVVSDTGHVTFNILKNHNAFMFSVQNSNNCLNLTDPTEIIGTTYPT